LSLKQDITISTIIKIVFVGKEAVDWIQSTTHVKHRISAVKLGQEMMKLGAFHHVTDKQEFTDEKSLYIWS